MFLLIVSLLVIGSAVGVFILARSGKKKEETSIKKNKNKKTFYRNPEKKKL